MATFNDVDLTPTSTREQRQRHVDDTNAALQLQGIEPDAETVALQRRYVAGEITAHDLIDWVLALLGTLDQSTGADQIAPRNLH